MNSLGKLTFLVAIAFGCVTFRSFAQATPQVVMKTFMKAMQKKDIDRATKVTHSRYHSFLGMMADAKLKDGADTVDHIDYANLQFKAVGEGGIIKYKNKDEDELFYLAKEDGEWKADLFGTMGNLGVGMMVMDFSVQGENALTFTVEMEYEIGGLTLRKKMNITAKPEMPMIRQFLADDMHYFRLQAEGASEKVTFNLSKDVNGELQPVISDPTLVNGVYEYRRK